MGSSCGELPVFPGGNTHFFIETRPIMSLVFNELPINKRVSHKELFFLVVNTFENALADIPLSRQFHADCSQIRLDRLLRVNSRLG